MASYSSYKKVSPDQIPAGEITTNDLALGAGHNLGTVWVYSPRGMACHTCSNAGGCVCQACGMCCLWTVPDNVSCVTFEIWSGGGGGPGHTCCNCCSYAIGGMGGNYAIKTISTVPGCQYTVCAGGSWPCSKSHTCGAGMGCRSYVTGYNLSNFCTMGACGGWMCNGDAWGPRHHHTCSNCNICSSFGADMGITGSAGMKPGHGMCHCVRTFGWTGQPPLIGKMHMVSATEAWCACGCYVSWPAGGGEPGISAYCGNWAKCCAGGSGQGGSGLVRITFM